MTQESTSRKMDAFWYIYTVEDDSVMMSERLLALYKDLKNIVKEAGHEIPWFHLYVVKEQTNLWWEKSEEIVFKGWR